MDQPQLAFDFVANSVDLGFEIIDVSRFFRVGLFPVGQNVFVLNQNSVDLTPSLLQERQVVLIVIEVISSVH